MNYKSGKCPEFLTIKIIRFLLRRGGGGGVGESKHSYILNSKCKMWVPVSSIGKISDS